MTKIVSFFDRIEFLRGKTKVYPWLESMGMSRGTVTGLKNGGMLSADNLSIIARAKNVNLNWLVSGEGAPYRVSAFADSESAIAHVHALGDEPWERITIVMVEQSSSFALIMQNPGSYDVAGKIFEYVISETIIAPISTEIFDEINALKAVHRQAIEATYSDASALMSGWQSARDFLSNAQLAPSFVQEAIGAYNLNRSAKDNLSLADRIARLDPDRKNRILGYLDSIDPAKKME